MVEHVTVDGDSIVAMRPIKVGENFNSRGAESRENDVVVSAGTRITYTEIAMLATVGASRVRVNRRPRVKESWLWGTVLFSALFVAPLI